MHLVRIHIKRNALIIKKSFIGFKLRQSSCIHVRNNLFCDNIHKIPAKGVHNIRLKCFDECFLIKATQIISLFLFWIIRKYRRIRGDLGTPPPFFVGKNWSPSSFFYFSQWAPLTEVLVPQLAKVFKCTQVRASK